MRRAEDWFNVFHTFLFLVLFGVAGYAFGWVIPDLHAAIVKNKDSGDASDKQIITTVTAQYTDLIQRMSRVEQKLDDKVWKN